ncbi:WD40-repeat-containing domain protein [Gongronella butleri]|nr:WD40-repeat-containing domain protein [Gongronella butleri]
MAVPISITANVLSDLRPAKVFKEKPAVLSSLSFDDTGELCITSSQNELMRVYDCVNGTMRDTVPSHKYGVGLVRFTHNQKCVVHSSTKEDNQLRYLSLHGKNYIRYFSGHTDRVTSLEMSTLNDQFLSTSMDGTVRLWDLGSSSCQGMIFTGAGSQPIAGIDPSGLVFAVATSNNQVLVYDIRKYSSGPFATWTLTEPSQPWTSMKFTNDGKHMLLTSSAGKHLLLDAFEGIVRKRLLSIDSPPHIQRSGEEVTLTADGQFAVEGGVDGFIRAWDLNDPNAEIPFLCQSSLHAPNPVHILGFNHVNMMMVSGGTEVAMWAPSSLMD